MTGKVRQLAGRSLYATVAIIVMLTGFIVIRPQRVAASGLANSCSSNVGAWDWPSWTAATTARSGTVTGGAVPGFDGHNSSYLMLGAKLNANTFGSGSSLQTQNNLELYVSSNQQDKLIFYMNGTDEHIKTLGGAPIYRETVYDLSSPTPRQGVVPGVYANGSNTDYKLTGSGNEASTLGFTTPCVEFSMNVLYDTTFTDPHYTNGPGWTSGTAGFSNGPSCSGITDIVCYASNLFSTVGSSIANAFQAFTIGLVNIFVPNGAQLSADWSSFYSTLQTKLGFLLWPFSFIGGVFTAAVTPTTSCCSIGAGTFMHASWSGIDLAYASTHMPTLWAYLTDVVKGLTILMLLFALRQKFLEITHK